MYAKVLCFGARAMHEPHAGRIVPHGARLQADETCGEFSLTRVAADGVPFGTLNARHD